MDDLISRAAAIAAIDEYLHGLDSCISEPDLKLDGYKNGLQVAIQELKALPAVDAVPVVRCAYCKHCFDMDSDPMEPYDGESEWYCDRFDRDTSAYEIDPYRFYCADGERREDANA